MSTKKLSRRSILALGAAFTMAGCAGAEWQTAYTPIPQLAANWRLSALSVSVPDDLIVSEDNSVFVPDADIVWQEENLGDRRAQVAAILREGITAGAQGLNGSVPVRFEVRLDKFHALNRRALYGAPQGTGVENINFDIRVVDARTGEVLLPVTRIYAEFPGLAGGAYTNALQQGQTQRMRIVQHIQETIAGWLGLGPDNREVFYRRGG